MVQLFTKEVFALKLRIKFSKTGVMQYVGHLDLMRYFQKAVTRAGIPVSYSAGFNPHQIMSFAAPLGLGITSEGEYFDMDTSEDVSLNEVVDNLNKAMVEGVKVISAHVLSDSAKPSMSLVAACDYIITPKDNNLDLSIFNKWQDEKEYLMLKKTKKSENTIDIKPLIYKLDVVDGCIKTQLASGSVANLKPLEMMNVLADKFLRLMGDSFYYHRTEIYAKNKEGSLIALSDYNG